MTDPDSACPSEATYRRVENRRQVYGSDLCGNCFGDEIETIEDIPDDWSLILWMGPPGFEPGTKRL